jgi:hypothetical protein
MRHCDFPPRLQICQLAASAAVDWTTEHNAPKMSNLISMCGTNRRSKTYKTKVIPSIIMMAALRADIKATVTRAAAM